MKNIKYHLNGAGNEYGEDHTLTNNWNPNINYGNEYVNVYFRIDAAYYQYQFTGYTEEDQREFDKEVAEIFQRLGWTVKERDSFGSCMTAHNGKQH